MRLNAKLIKMSARGGFIPGLYNTTTQCNLHKHPTLFNLWPGHFSLQAKSGGLFSPRFMASLLILFLISFSAQVPACFIFGVDNVTTRETNILNWVLGPQFANRSPFRRPIHLCRNIFKYPNGKLLHKSHRHNSMANGFCQWSSVSSGYSYGDDFGAHFRYLYLP
jgi:hypothetical protein